MTTRGIYSNQDHRHEAAVRSRDQRRSRGRPPAGATAGIQSGDTVTIKGKGVPRLRGSGRGDLNVQIIVETPARMDEEQRALVAQLAKLRDEERPEALMGVNSKGVFGKIKDAFK